jgi:hypothetical protein
MLLWATLNLLVVDRSETNLRRAIDKYFIGLRTVTATSTFDANVVRVRYYHCSLSSIQSVVYLASYLRRRRINGRTKPYEKLHFARIIIIINCLNYVNLFGQHLVYYCMSQNDMRLLPINYVAISKRDNIQLPSR